MAIKAMLLPVLVTQVIKVKHVQRNKRHSSNTGRKSSDQKSSTHQGTGGKGLTPLSMSQMQWQPEIDVRMCDTEARSLREEGARQTPKSIGKVVLTPFSMSQMQWQQENDVGMCDTEGTILARRRSAVQTPKFYR